MRRSGTAALAVALSACTSTPPGAESTGSSATSMSGSPTASAGATHEHSFGDVVQITPDTLMVVGRHLDIAKGQADVANSLLYRHDGVVYWVDTGATHDFVAPLRRAFQQLQPYTRIVLVNTHRHADHVGNNALLDALGASSVEHNVPQAEIATMRDQVGYFVEGFSVISPFRADFADSTAASAKLLNIFQPIEVESGHVTPLESLPSRKSGSAEPPGLATCSAGRSPRSAGAGAHGRRGDRVSAGSQAARPNTPSPSSNPAVL
jgi:hypothetical protein